MQDEIIRGTGNSRYLKSVSDFMTRYPTYADFCNALVAGTLPIDLNGKNPAGIAQQGTPLNKANLLSDATAVALDPDSPPATPDEAFDMLKDAPSAIEVEDAPQQAIYKLWSDQNVKDFDSTGSDLSTYIPCFASIAVDNDHTLVATNDYGYGLFTFNTQTGECISRAFPIPTEYPYSSIYWAKIIHAQNKFVAVGYSSYTSGSTGTYRMIGAVSTDGITWTAKAYSKSTSQNYFWCVPDICYDAVNQIFYTTDFSIRDSSSIYFFRSSDPYNLDQTRKNFSAGTAANGNWAAKGIAVGANGEVYLYAEGKANSSTSDYYWYFALFGSTNSGDSWSRIDLRSETVNNYNHNYQYRRFNLTHETNEFGGYPLYFDANNSFITTPQKVRVLDGLVLRPTDFSFVADTLTYAYRSQRSVTANGKTAIVCAERRLATGSICNEYVILDADNISNYCTMSGQSSLMYPMKNTNFGSFLVAPMADGYAYAYKIALRIKGKSSIGLMSRGKTIGRAMLKAVGKYIGNNAYAQSIYYKMDNIFFVDTGFTPSVLLLAPYGVSPAHDTNGVIEIGTGSTSGNNSCVLLAENGFIVVPGTVIGNNNYNFFNWGNAPYQYLAIGDYEGE